MSTAAYDIKPDIMDQPSSSGDYMDEDNNPANSSDVLEKSSDSHTQLKDVKTKQKKFIPTKGSFIKFFKKKRSSEKVVGKWEEGGDRSLVANDLDTSSNTAETDNLKATVKSLNDKIADLQIQVEEGRQNTAVLRSNAHESEHLKIQNENLTDETERLHLQVTFLEEEKVDLGKKVDELQDELEEVQITYNSSKKDKRYYQKRYKATCKQNCTIVNGLSKKYKYVRKDNCYMIHQGLDGDGLEKVIPAKDEVTKLETENMNMMEKLLKLKKTLVRKNMHIKALKGDLYSAAEILNSTGIGWKSKLQLDNISECNVSISEFETCEENKINKTNK